MLVETQILDKYSRLESLIEKHFSEDSRYSNIMKFIELFQDRICTAPASTKKHIYSSFMGGYLTHILIVYDISMDLYQLWKKYSKRATYSENTVAFVALFHCIGKLGDIDNLYYIHQTDDYRVDKYGEVYMVNPKIQNMNVTDRTLWLLQKFNIEVSDEEWLAIRLSAGMYEDANKEYLSPNSLFNDQNIIQSNLPILLHHAANMACRVEYEYWKYNDYEMFVNGAHTEDKNMNFTSYNDYISDDIDNLLEEYT